MPALLSDRKIRSRLPTCSAIAWVLSSWACPSVMATSPSSAMTFGAPMGTPKVIALEGEFAMTEGHAQELKTQAIALQVGKRLRIFLSDNNAGIDDSLIGGVVSSRFTGYRLIDQWTSYGWNVQSLADGHDYDQIVGALQTMEAGPGGSPSDDRDRQDHQGVLARR